MRDRFTQKYNLIMQSLASDVASGAKAGALIGTGAGTAVGAVGGGVFGGVAGGTAGLVLGLPIGIISGAAKWLANKEKTEDPEEKDKNEIQAILAKIFDKTATQADAAKLKEFCDKYKFEEIDKQS